MALREWSLRSYPVAVDIEQPIEDKGELLDGFMQWIRDEHNVSQEASVASDQSAGIQSRDVH